MATMFVSQLTNGNNDYKSSNKWQQCSMFGGSSDVQ